MVQIKLTEDDLRPFDPVKYAAVKERVRPTMRVVVDMRPPRLKMGLVIYDDPIGPKLFRDIIHVATKSLPDEFSFKSRFTELRTDVLRRHGLSLEQLNGGQRSRAIVRARHELWYLASIQTTLSLATIAKMSGGRDHTTILAGIRAEKARRTGKPDGRIEANRDRARRRYWKNKSASAGSIVE